MDSDRKGVGLILTIDYETRSESPLDIAGGMVYSLHPSTEVMCMALKVDDEPTKIWIPEYFANLVPMRFFNEHYPMGQGIIVEREIIPLMQQADTIEAHNVFFERCITENVLPHWPKVPPHKWRCSAAKAAAMGLPRKLGQAGNALNLPIVKDNVGHAVMLKMCKPRKPTKKDPSVWHEKPEDFLTIFKYCISDVDAEHTLSKALPDLSPQEQQVWFVDQEINYRGLHVDVPAAQAAVGMIETYKAALIPEFQKITGLNTPGQREKVLEWMKGRGLVLSDYTAGTIDKALKREDLTPAVKRVLEIRQSTAKSSTKKFEAFVAGANAQDRMCDTTMYHGAGTGRWAGRRIQPHNMPRKMPKGFSGIIDNLIGMDLRDFKLFYGDLMPVLSSCIRGLITAAPGYELLCADYASIEGRVLAWLADEYYITENYYNGIDPYIFFASQISGIDYNTIKTGYDNHVSEYEDIRFNGKTGELACGYQGWEGAVKNFAPDMPLERRVEIAKVWRRNRPATVAFWKEVEKRAIAAVQYPGHVFECKRVKFRMTGRWLQCRLPSGRLMSYYDPMILLNETPWGELRPALSYMSMVDGHWVREFTYGGQLTENIVQAIARDILAEALLRLTAEGYAVVMHVHDEIIAEVLAGTRTIEEYIATMVQACSWAYDLPIGADGFVTQKYHK